MSHARTAGRRAVTASLLAVLMVFGVAGAAHAWRTPLLITSFGKIDGKMWFDDGKHIGYRFTITDRARDNKCVYAQVNGIRDNAPDYGWKRLTQDVCGSSRDTRTQVKKVISAVSFSVDGYAVRVCKNVNNRPDPCGARSNITRKGLGVYG